MKIKYFWLIAIIIASNSCSKVSQEEESIFTELRKNLSQFDKRTVLIKYKEYSPELKSMIWKDKIQSVINISPNLEPSQVASLKKLLFLVNESFFTQSLVQLMSSNIEVASWIQNDSKLFSMDEGLSIFGTIENYTYVRQPLNAVRFDNNFINNDTEKYSSFIPPTSPCYCSCICRWNCPGDEVMCVESSQGCAVTGSGCGWFWVQACYGLCESNTQ